MELGISEDQRHRLWHIINRVRHDPRLGYISTDNIIDAIIDSGWFHELLSSSRDEMNSRLNDLVRPQWRTNHGADYDNVLDAYGGGRNDVIDNVREILGVKPKDAEHIGGNAEDCPACVLNGGDIPYPWICPGKE